MRLEFERYKLMRLYSKFKMLEMKSLEENVF